MNILIEKILREAGVIEEITFSLEKNHGYDFIFCKYKKKKIGYVSSIILTPEEGYPDEENEDEDKQQHMLGTFTGHGFYELEETMPRDKYLQLIDNTNFALLETIKVDQKFQKMGIGEMLIKKLLSELKSKNVKTIFLHAEQIENKELDYLIGFYKKCGFSELKNYDGESSLMYRKI